MIVNRDRASVCFVCSIVRSKGIEPMLEDLIRAATSSFPKSLCRLVGNHIQSVCVIGFIWAERKEEK